MTLTQATDFLSSLTWHYAKTYPTAPHEYSVLSWLPNNPRNKEKFVQFAHLIRLSGKDEIFHGRKSRVLHLDGFKYWTMDDPLENTDLINRTFSDESLKSKIADFVQSGTFIFKKGMSLSDVRELMEKNVK